MTVRSDNMIVRTMDSPIGSLTLVASESGLRRILFPRERGLRRRFLNDAREDAGNRLLNKTEKQLNEYFAGRRKSFDVSLDLDGTPFQKRLWKMLREIPYGQTTTYGELASRVGDVRKARAVGGAMGSNPIPVIVPCHRVVGKSGSLTGFGGGLKTKSFLLDLERGKL